MTGPHVSGVEGKKPRNHLVEKLKSSSALFILSRHNVNCHSCGYTVLYLFFLQDPVHPIVAVQMKYAWVKRMVQFPVSASRRRTVLRRTTLYAVPTGTHT